MTHQLANSGRDGSPALEADGVDVVDARPGQVSVWRALSYLYDFMSPRRRRHFFASLALMLLGGLAEAMTIGAVFPFLLIVSDSGGGEGHPAIEWIRAGAALAPGESLLPLAVGVLVAAALFAGSVRLLLIWVSQSFIFRLGHEIGSEIYARILRQSYNLHVLRNSSDVLAGLEKVQIVIFSVLLPLMLGIVAAFTSTVIVVLLFLIDPIVALVATGFLSLLYLAVSWTTSNTLKHNSGIINALHTERMKQAQEGLGGIRDIILDQSQAVFEQQFRIIDARLRHAQTVNVFVASGPRYVVESAGIILMALLAVWISSGPGGISAALPVLGALALGAQRLLPMLQQVYSGWSTFRGSADVLLDIVRLLRAPQITTAPRDPQEAPRHFQRSLAFRQVHFRYWGSKEEALRGIELEIRRGERVGILGKTGSGKSTLIDIMMGLLDPTQGQVEIDGVALSDSNRANWQAQIGHVPQSIYLSDSSLAMNIAFGQSPDAMDRERLVAATRQAQIHEFIASLPDGYETRVGERGVRLSGGQRQRIGIARALYKKSSILVFDEATSALDSDTEQEVMQSLGAIAAGLTVVLIAHRLSTLASCDRVIRLENGRIAQSGTYQQVVLSR